MEYIIIGSIVIAMFIFLLSIIKVEKLRNRANALFLEAEKYVKENDNKFEYVCSNLYRYLPNVVKLFISEDFLKDVVQMIYNRTREIAKDLLDDRKKK